MTLSFSNATNANIQFLGSGTGATINFNSNSSGQGFQITGSTSESESSVGLFGTLGGSFSYTTAQIVTTGSMQTAPVTSSGGTLTINDGNGQTLSGAIEMVSVTTIGAAGVLNLDAAINLTDVTYSGTNQDLTQLRNEADDSAGGTVTISFQFVPAQTLTSLAAAGADNTSSYSGSIETVGSLEAVPEPSSLAVAGMGALGLIGYTLRRQARRRS